MRHDYFYVHGNLRPHGSFYKEFRGAYVKSGSIPNSGTRRKGDFGPWFSGPRAGPPARGELLLQNFDSLSAHGTPEPALVTAMFLNIIKARAVGVLRHGKRGS